MRAKDLTGINIVVTAGPTRERLDPVRYLSNFSSGKMGYAIAEAALERGADVTLISGPVSIEPPKGAKLVSVESTIDLLDAMLKYAPECDIAIQAAAPADYRPAVFSEQKIKKKGGDGLFIELAENPDVAATIGKNKRKGQVFAVFAAETENLLENAIGKMRRKNADMIIANDVTKQGAGFGADTNIASIITEKGVINCEMMPKKELAGVILDAALEIMKNG